MTAVTSPEILAPAGSYDAALAAFQYGADAIYLGLPRFSARADAQNITIDQLKLLCAYAKTFAPAKKIYITLNTLIHEDERRDVVETLSLLDDIRPDGVIIQDLGLASIVRRSFPDLAMHASTQLAAHNIKGVEALKKLGFTRVVTARELTLREVAEIRRATGVEIEIFVHGALCYSISGLCLFSAMEFNRSGNRGRCAYCCRQAFNRAYPFSMRDLAFAPDMDQVVASGADSLKIEGRMKSPLYVACVCDYYRRKRDGELTAESEAKAIQDLQTVFSRPWTELYAMGEDASPLSIIDPVSIGHRGAKIGETLPPRRPRTLRFKTARALEKFDGIQIDLPQGGRPYGFSIRELFRAGERRPRIGLDAGLEAEIPLPPDAPSIPAGSVVFCSSSQEVKRRFTIRSIRQSQLPTGRVFDVEVTLTPHGAQAQAGNVSVSAEMPLSPANAPERTYEALVNAFSRTGGSAWRLGTLKLNDLSQVYFPASKANELRRQLIEKMDETLVAGSRNPESVVRPALPFEAAERMPMRVGKFRLGQRPEEFDLSGIEETVLAIESFDDPQLGEKIARWRSVSSRLRLALPFWIRNRQLEIAEKTVCELAKQGYSAWEAGDLSGLSILKAQGIRDITADWTCYAFNYEALSQWFELGVLRIALSPEMGCQQQQALAAMGRCECICRQHVPLFFSVTAPCVPAGREGVTELESRSGRYVTGKVGPLYVTTAKEPLVRSFPAGVPVRFDFSWSL